jgi:hypothetical protein
MRICLDMLNTLRIGKPTNEIEYSQYAKAFGALMDVINGNWKDYDAAYQSQRMVAEGVEDENPFGDKKYSKEELAVLASKALPDNKVAVDTFDSLLERMDRSKTNLKY